MPRTLRYIAFAAVVVIAAMANRAPAAAPRPNIIHIVADDLGWGDVGFNGQTRIKTPYIDSIRNDGMALASAYCPAPVCAPTRAAMLSGFHNGHTLVDRNGIDIDTGFRLEDVFITEVLKPAGYTTGVMGKWGFGASDSGTEQVVLPNSLPNNQGVDHFYGYLSHTRAHNYFQPYLWKTDPTAPDGVTTTATNGTYTHDLISNQATAFVAAQANQSSPFYLEFAPTIPHQDIDAIESVSGWDAAYSSAEYSSWTLKQKKYAAMVTRMDASIGELLQRIDDPNGDGNTADSIAQRTLVVFTSDNGPTNADSAPIGFFDSNGPYRGGKSDLYDGGLRTPFAMRWTGTIAPGTTSNRIIDLADLFPTMAELALAETPVGIDGVSFAPLITGQGTMRTRDYFVFEHHGANPGPAGGLLSKWAIRQGDFKLIKFADGSFGMYNLATDPGEVTNIVGSQAALKAELEALAIAEGVEQNTDYAVTYRTWTGNAGASVSADENWNGDGTPDNTWSASVQNNTSALQIAVVDTNTSFIGFGVRGVTAPQVVTVNAGVTLHGRNEIRVSSGGQLDLRGGNLDTLRWVDVRSNGALSGKGTIHGDVFNAGVITPGVATDAKPVGKLEIFGDFTQMHTGVLAVQLGSVQPGSDFDQLSITGDAKLGGLLNIQLLSGFSLIDNQSFTILDITGSRSGIFMGLPEGTRIGAFGGTDLFITYHGNGGSDVMLYTTGFAPLETTPVPEPAAASMIVLLASACLRRRRRRLK